MVKKDNDNSRNLDFENKMKASKPKAHAAKTAADTAPFPLRNEPLKHPKGTVVESTPFRPHKNDMEFWRIQMENQVRR